MRAAFDRSVLLVASLIIVFFWRLSAASAEDFPDDFDVINVGPTGANCLDIKLKDNATFSIVSFVLVDLKNESRKACFVRGYFLDGDDGRQSVPSKAFESRIDHTTLGTGTEYVSRLTGLKYQYVSKYATFGGQNRFCANVSHSDYKNFSDGFFLGADCRNSQIGSMHTYEAVVYYVLEAQLDSMRLVEDSNIKVAAIFFQVDQKGEARRIGPPDYLK